MIERRNVALYWKGNADWWTIFPAQTIIIMISRITDGQNPQTQSFTFWQGYFNVINFGGNLVDAFKLKFILSNCSNKQEWFVFILIKADSSFVSEPQNWGKWNKTLYVLHVFLAPTGAQEVTISVRKSPPSMSRNHHLQCYKLVYNWFKFVWMSQTVLFEGGV